MTDLANLGIEFQSRGASDVNAQLDAYSAKAGKAADAADKLNATAGKSGAGFNDMAKGIANANKTVTESDRTVANMGASLNAAMTRNTAMFDSFRKGVTAANTEVAASVGATTKLSEAHGGLSTQGQAALHSVRSFTEQVAMGIPLTQAATSQFNHLTYAATGDGGLKGAFKEVGNVFGSILTPMRLATAGAVGLAAAGLYIGYNWSESQAQIDRAVIGIGAATGSTASDLNAFAKANASATGLTIGEARNVAIEFTKTGDIAVKNLKGVGDAVHGYAILTGEDATKATKDLASALSGDLVKGAEALNQTYMAFDSSALDYIQTLQTSGERAKATQFIIDSIAPANLKAADSVNILTKSYQFLASVMSSIKNGPPAIVNGSNPQDRLQQAQSLKQSAGSSFSGQLSGGFGSDILGGADSVPIVNQLDDVIKTAKKDAEDFGGIGKEAFTKLSIEAKNATDAIFPQIEQIRRLEVELSKLEEAKSKGAAGPNVDDAINAYKNQIAGLEQSVATANLYNTRVKEISRSWGDVDQQTALALESARNELPVYEAVGGAAKMAAQYTADYANYIDQGKTKTEAAALASARLAASQAQVNSSARETLAALRDQAAVAGARTPLEAASAQAQATFNGLLRQGVDSEIAMSVAAQQESNARAQIYEQVQKAVRASDDQLQLTRAAGTDQEAAVKSAIAYSNAMDAGATSAQAAAISTNVLYTETLKAAQAADRLADSELAAARAAHDAQYADITPGGDNSFGFFQLKSGIEGNSARAESGFQSYNWQQQGVQSQANSGVLSGGALEQAWSDASKTPDINATVNAQITRALSNGGVDAALRVAKQFGADAQQQFQNVDALYQIKNGTTSDNAVKVANLQDELAWLQSQPETIARDQNILQLMQSIDQLKNSTDANTAAQQASLNPLYSGRGALAIGYYHAANGLNAIAQGPSTGDQIPLHLKVNGGEQIKVIPKDQQGGSNDNSRTITNYNTFNFGGSQGNGRRNERQLQQGFAQVMDAVA